MSRAPAAMLSRGRAISRRGIIVRTRWGWGPSASGKTKGLVLALAFVTAVPMAALAQSDISGAWEVTIGSPQSAMAIDANFKQAGEAVTGVVTSLMGSVELTGTLVKDALSFNYTVPLQGQNLDIQMAGKVAGDSMTGTVTIVGIGEVSWTAKRKPAGSAAAAATSATTAPESTTAPSTALGAGSATLVGTGAAGAWDIVLNVIGIGEFPMGASFTQVAEKVSGTLRAQGGEIPVSGTMIGTTLKLEFVAPTPQGDIPVTITGDLGPDGFAGTASLVGVGEAIWTGTRTKK